MRTGNIRINQAIFLALAIVLLVALTSGCGMRGGVGANKLSSTDDVKIVKDIKYYTGKSSCAGRHILDLYLPTHQKNFPVIFFVHGGAWVGGDKAATAQFGMEMAKRGLGVVNVNYRLYPWVQYPGMVKDVARAFKWTTQHIQEYGGNDDDIFVCGHSAGAHLIALISTNSRFLDDLGVPMSKIKGAMPISGIYKMDDQRFRKIFGENSDTKRDASPIYQITSSTPPFLILHADNELEDLGQQAKDFARALRDKKIEYKLLQVNDRHHNSILEKIGTTGDPATAAILDFVQRHK